MILLWSTKEVYRFLFINGDDNIIIVIFVWVQKQPFYIRYFKELTALHHNKESYMQFHLYIYIYYIQLYARNNICRVQKWI